MGFLVALVVLAPHAHAQYLLNENFDDPSLSGWEVSGPNNSNIRWNVSGGSLNILGHNSPVVNLNTPRLQLKRELDLGGQPEPTTWQIEMRIFMPNVGAQYGSSFHYWTNDSVFKEFGSAHIYAYTLDVPIMTLLGTDYPRIVAAFVQINTWNTYRVVITPTNRTLYVNDNFVGTVGDAGPSDIKAFYLWIQPSRNMDANPIRYDYIRIVPEPASGWVLATMIGVSLKKRKSARRVASR